MTILGYERIDRDGLVRIDEAISIDSGKPAKSRIHAATTTDVSPAWTGYESRCGLCWIGAPHTVDRHRRAPCGHH